MKTKISLRTALALLLALSTIGAGKCNSNKLDRVIASLDIAATIPSFPADARTGFRETATALRTVRDNPTAERWQQALTIFEGLQSRNVFRVNDPNTQANITAIVSIVRVLLDSAAPSSPSLAPTAGGTGRDVPDAGKLKESDVKALEQAVKQAKG